MTRSAIVGLAAALALAGLAGSAEGAAARTRVRGVAVGQHATVMNNIYQARQQNNAVINQVQNNIRASQQRPY